MPFGGFGIVEVVFVTTRRCRFLLVGKDFCFLLVLFSLGIGCLLLIDLLLDEDEGVDVDDDSCNLDNDVDEHKGGGGGRRLAFIDVGILPSLVAFSRL